MSGRMTEVCDVANGDATQAEQLRSPNSVGVVIPCYNYGWCLRNCVESVLGQTGVDLQVLIIDDASTDDSAQLAAEFASADPRVEFRVHPVNHGHIKTYNEGLEWTSSTYTVLLDADDMLTPGSLQRACDLLEAHPVLGFVYGRPLLFRDDHSRPRPRAGKGRWAIWPGREWFELRCRLTENCIRSPEVVMRSSLLRQIGGFREELPHTADFELWMRLALYSDVGYVRGPHQALVPRPPDGHASSAIRHDPRGSDTVLDSIPTAIPRPRSDDSRLPALGGERQAQVVATGAPGCLSCV
jgi:hypothetical protein